MKSVPLAVTAALALAAALNLSAGLAAPSQAATTTVCTGVKGCTVVARADIDGDGKADQVGVAATGITKPDGGKIAVRVRTAKGKTLQTTGSDVIWYYAPFQGVAAIDGVAGQEIVVGDLSAGAHALQWRVVTYRKGRLTTLASPPGSSLTRASRWATDGSAAFHYGWSRSVSAKGVVTLVRKQADGPAGGAAKGPTTRYTWKSGRWVKSSSTTTHYSFRAAQAIEGWHIKGLRAWPAAA